jgi:broad specificity phosphatase PhoE
MPRLHLVRHARSLVDPATAPHTWDLDPAGLPDLAALAVSGRLPTGAAWYSSPEPKAVATARGLTDRPVTVVDALAEHRRGVHWFADPDDFRAAVRRAFDAPDEPAVAEWERLAATRDRLLPAVRRILDGHPDQDVVLAGHGTAWTLLVSELTGRPADLDAWAALRMPDVWTLTRTGSGTARWECDTGTSHD